MSIRVRVEHANWASWRDDVAYEYRESRGSNDLIYLGDVTAASVMEGKPGRYVLASDFPRPGDGLGVESMWKWEAA